MNRIKILPVTKRNDDVIVKLVIICPSKMEEYKSKINKTTCNLTILYTSSFHDVVEHIQHNSTRRYHIITPNFFYDDIKKGASSLAKLIKIINPENKIYCYSVEFTDDTEYLDLIVSGYKIEVEIKIIIDLLK